MSEITIAEFPFVANKSFVSGRTKPITIPARLYGELRQNGLAEGTPAAITFRKGPRIVGAIRAGFRAGGRYYQITMRASQTSPEADSIKIGARLKVKIIKTLQDWIIEVN